MSEISQNNQTAHPEKTEASQLVIKLYESLLKETREIEKNFLSLIVPLISSIGIFGYSLKEFLYNPLPKTAIIFTLATFASLLLCQIVFLSTNIFAYTYRSNQLVISNIEDRYKELQELLPNSWNLKAKLSECKGTDPPEIYKLFRILSIITFIFLTLVYFLILLLNRYLGFLEISLRDIYTFRLTLAICFDFILVFIILNYKFTWSFYEIKLKRLQLLSSQDR